MADSGKAEQVEKRALTVSWPVEHFEKIEKAAEILTELNHFPVTPTDIIRAGAIKHAEALLSEAAAA